MTIYDRTREKATENNNSGSVKTKSLMQKAGYYANALAPIIIVAMIFILGGCNRSDTVLGEVVEYPIHNGTRGVIYADRNDVTDELLIEFLNDVDVSEYNWFTIDFGDGTGYFFTSNSFFSYGPITEIGGVSEQPFQYAQIHDESIQWSLVLDVPHFRTVGEYFKWANQHNIEVNLISISRPAEPLSTINYLEFKVVGHPTSAVEGDVMHLRIE